MKTFSALLALCAGNSPVTGEFPSQRPMTRSSDVLFDLRLNKRPSKQSRGWWFETPSSSLWRHRNAMRYNEHQWVLVLIKRWVWLKTKSILFTPCIGAFNKPSPKISSQNQAVFNVQHSEWCPVWKMYLTVLHGLIKAFEFISFWHWKAKFDTLYQENMTCCTNPSFLLLLLLFIAYHELHFHDSSFCCFLKGLWCLIKRKRLGDELFNIDGFRCQCS